VSAPRRIVVTRAEGPGESWRRRLEATGIPCLHLPLIDYEPLPLPANLDLRAWDWLLFTSPQAARSLFGRMPEAPAAPAVALADGTAAALAELGRPAQLNLEVEDGTGMAAAFSSRVSPPARLLLPGAERRLPEPRAGLLAAGFEVETLATYRTRPARPDSLPENPFLPGDCVFFASPSALRAFRAAWPELAVDCAAIGRSTAEACVAGGLVPRIAQAPNLESLCAAVGLELSGDAWSNERGAGRA